MYSSTVRASSADVCHHTFGGVCPERAWGVGTGPKNGRQLSVSGARNLLVTVSDGPPAPFGCTDCSGKSSSVPMEAPSDAWVVLDDDDSDIVSLVTADVVEIQVVQRMEQLEALTMDNSTRISDLAERLDSVLKRVGECDENALSCKRCGSTVGHEGDIVSKSYRGKRGPAVLMKNVSNVDIGKEQTCMLLSGLYSTAPLSCAKCTEEIGWRYTKSFQAENDHKVGMSCIETSLLRQPIT